MSYNDVGARFAPIVGWPGEKTRVQKRSPFKAPWSATLLLLRRELRHLDAKNLIVQLDMDEKHIRQDGYPRADARARGPGIILTFDSKHGPLSYPCDTYRDWETNMRAIALALEALRTVDRYGVTKRGEQYTGWKRLGDGTTQQPAMTVEQAATFVGQVVGWLPNSISADREIFRTAYIAAAKKLHPDAGGSTDQFQRLQEARRVLEQRHGVR